MTVLERIKDLCRTKKGISITTLEQELGYSNGSLSKAKDIPSSRIMDIANYFEVSMDYVMSGKEFDAFSDENAHLLARIRRDIKLSEALLKYFDLSTEKKNHIIDTINMLSEA